MYVFIYKYQKVCSDYACNKYTVTPMYTFWFCVFNMMYDLHISVFENI